MATFKTKSNEITNILATPKVESNAFFSGAHLREKVATVEVAAADTTGDVYAFVTLPSNARVSSLEVANDAMTTGTFDMGLYTVDASGNITTVSAQLFASAVVLTSAHAFTDYTYEATATNIDKVEKRLWELLGLTADPLVTYVVGLAATNDVDTAATLSLRVRYTI